jgi:hypothetical protein
MNKGGRGKHRGGRAPDGEKSQETIDGHAVSYVPRLVKCGKAGCKKCATADGGHGPYWYKVYRTAEGKVKTEYYGKQAPAAESAPPPAKTVKLSELIAEMLKQTDGIFTYYIAGSGTYRPVPDDAFVALEEGAGEEVFYEYRITQEDLQIAALIVNHDPNYIMLPGADMIDQYDMLEAFIETVEDDEIYDQLQLAYQAVDFFESYFEVLADKNLLQSWFKFRDDHYRNVALHWCRENNIGYSE